jgi:p-aminobenzoyl-glutamate transporter AbgT
MSGDKLATAPGGFLGTVERVGNKLPDPAMLFVGLLFVVWILSWLLSYVTFDVIDPRSGDALVINNLLSGSAFTEFLSVMVTNFSHFHPVGVVLVAMLGIGVAEATGFINTGLRALLNVTSDRFLTPMVIMVGIASHTAADAGYVLVIPLGGVIFYAAGRHPLAGIAAAFAGVSGGFSASFIPSSIDPLLQGLSQAGARILDPAIELNPLNNYFFTTASSLLIIGIGWYVTSRIIEPRLANTEIDGDAEDLPEMHDLQEQERKGLRWSLIAMLLGTVLLIVTALPAGSPWRDASGNISSFQAGAVDALDRVADLLPVSSARRGLWGRCRNREELQRHHCRHDQIDAQHVVLPCHHVFHRTVCLRLRSVQPRRIAGAAGCRPPEGHGNACCYNHCRHYHSYRRRQYFRWLSIRQVGTVGPNIYSDAHVTWHFA